MIAAKREFSFFGRNFRTYQLLGYVGCKKIEELRNFFFQENITSKINYFYPIATRYNSQI